MKIFIHKKSRLPLGPYTGPACEKAGIASGLYYDNIASALVDVEKLNQVNPVGFRIGYDFSEYSKSDLYLFEYWFDACKRAGIQMDYNSIEYAITNTRNKHE